MKTLHRELQHIDPKKISVDKNNPRGLTESQIISDPEFKKLISSIDQYGILVPLIVKPDENAHSSYILIDGERRLRASLSPKVNLKDVPVLVAKDDIDGRILAYQVHMNWLNWNKAAETKALKKIILDLKEDKPALTDKEILKKLKEITAHKPPRLSDLLKLCKYDDKTIEKIISDELNMSYPVQIESSFINPLKRHHPDIETQFRENEIRKILIQKAFDKKLGNTRFLMDKFKVVFQSGSHKEKIEQLLINFLKDRDKDIADTLREFERITKGKTKNEQKTDKKSEKEKQKEKNPPLGKRIFTQDTFSYKAMKVTKKQQTLISDIRNNFEKIGSSFTEEEREYIAEALFCLEKHCFKAATLMAWSSGISRILKYIKNNLSDFNNASQAMSDNKKSVWKHFSSNFQKNATSVEDIRVNSNDIQLLCYLAFKGIISSTQFNKLQANYKIRCDCAHPTDIELSSNELTAIFENIYHLILNNQTLK